MIDILIQRNIAGHKAGDVVSIHPDDERYARYAGHIAAGNAVELDPDPADYGVDQVADAVLSAAPPTGTPWIHPDEDYDVDPLHDDGDPED